MRFTFALFALTLASTQAFTVEPSTATRANTQLAASRRDVLNKAAAVAVSGAVALGPASPAFAADYVPKFDDMKQIYILGVSLDKLAEKLGNPDLLEAGLDGVRLFNKDPGFYPGYAKNFIGKTVKKQADMDPRVGYIKQACTLIGSIEQTAAGGAALMDKAAITESISRVRKAQALIAKFLAESGVKDEKIDAFIAKHK